MVDIIRLKCNYFFPLKIFQLKIEEEPEEQFKIQLQSLPS